MMRSDLTADQQSRMKALFDAIGVKGEFSRTAKRLLKQTPAYAEARQRGEAREWLDEEAQSFAETAYEVLLNRVEEAGGDR
jgi:hypothetical protein